MFLHSFTFWMEISLIDTYSIEKLGHNTQSLQYTILYHVIIFYSIQQLHLQFFIRFQCVFHYSYYIIQVPLHSWVSNVFPHNSQYVPSIFPYCFQRISTIFSMYFLEIPLYLHPILIQSQMYSCIALQQGCCLFTLVIQNWQFHPLIKNFI